MTETLIDRLRLSNRRNRRSGEPPQGSARLLLACSGLFGVLAISVALGNPLAPVDHTLTTLLQQIRSASVDRWLVGITLFGDGWHLTLLSLLLCLALGLKHNTRAVLHWLAALIVLALLNQLFKFGLAIERPQILLQPLTSFSFPSAHTSNSTLFFTLLAMLTAQQRPHRQRRLIYGLATLAVLAIGVSRIYLGVHWFSDVLGGILLGLAVGAATGLSYSRFAGGPISWQRAWIGPIAMLISACYLLSRLDAGLLRYLSSSQF